MVSHWVWKIVVTLSMTRVKFLAILLGIAIAALAIFLVVRSDAALVFHPKGIIAHSELRLIITNVCLMLSVIVPTGILLLFTAWKYRSSNVENEYRPEKIVGTWGQIGLWAIPSVVIAVMVVITWNATHTLDPYRPLKSEKEPLRIQVVALDWKWLFIYPEQGIATVNFVQFPAGIPIRFELSADNSPMNSFWIPQLSGQIYTMTGMVTPLHIMADGPGEYSGKAVEINGEGYADMTFVAKSCSQADFDEWIRSVKSSPLRLTRAEYKDLSRRSVNRQVVLFSSVEENLFFNIVMTPMEPQ